jgi:hypothetical protein
MKSKNNNKTRLRHQATCSLLASGMLETQLHTHTHSQTLLPALFPLPKDLLCYGRLLFRRVSLDITITYQFTQALALQQSISLIDSFVFVPALSKRAQTGLHLQMWVIWISEEYEPVLWKKGLTLVPDQIRDYKKKNQV